MSAARLDAVVLLVDKGEDTVGVYFMSREDARSWEDEHPELTVVGCVTLVSRVEALA